jgi:hypothetical protein
MPYASVSDVQGLIPFVPISRESKPSEGIIQQWIGDVEVSVDTALAALGYQIPLVAEEGKTTDAARRLLKDVIAHAIAARVLRSRPNPEQDPENFQKRWDAFWKALRDPADIFELPDLIMTSEAIVKESATRVSSNLKELLDEDPMRIHRTQVF